MLEQSPDKANHAEYSHLISSNLITIFVLFRLSISLFSDCEASDNNLPDSFRAQGRQFVNTWTAA